MTPSAGHTHTRTCVYTRACARTRAHRCEHSWLAGKPSSRHLPRVWKHRSDATGIMNSVARAGNLSGFMKYLSTENMRGERKPSGGRNAPCVLHRRRGQLHKQFTTTGAEPTPKEHLGQQISAACGFQWASHCGGTKKNPPAMLRFHPHVCSELRWAARHRLPSLGVYCTPGPFPRAPNHVSSSCH